MDPQDLLYSNNYAEINILSEKSINRDIEYYDRFTDYEDKNVQSDYSKYIDDDEYEESQINLNKTLNNKWPVDGKKNHYPLFDTYTNDISMNRYKKEILTKISIDNTNRDISKYENPNSFTISLPRTFNNVKKLVINDLNFTNINQSVTNINNNLSWQYPTENFLNANDINDTIIPVPGSKTIIYSNLPNSVYKYVTTGGIDYIPYIEDYLVYQTDIIPAYYNLETFINIFKIVCSEVVHGQNYLNNNIQVIEEPYLAQPKKIGNPHLFSCFIDPITSLVNIVNRMEELSIVSIQTFSPYETNYSNVDIFYYYSSVYASSGNYSLDNNLIYITVEASPDTSYQYFNNIYNLILENAFPLVITNLYENIAGNEKFLGGISERLLSYTAFYDLNIYLTNGYTESEIQNTISYYKYIDTITINNTVIINGAPVVITNTYLRFGLSFSSSGIHGASYDPKGVRYIPSSTNNYVYNSSLNNYFSRIGSNTNYIYNEYIFYIGRALLFRWIYDQFDGNYLHYEYETMNEKKRSVLHVLGWPIANNTYKIYTVDINKGYNFVQSSSNIQITYEKDIITFNPKVNNIPPYSLNLQNYNNNYYFVNNSYIYIKLAFNTNSSLKVDTFLASVSDELLLYNQQYVNSTRFNVEIGQDYTNIKECDGLVVLVKDYSNIFAKIMLSNVPGNYDIVTSNIINNDAFTINHHFVMDNIDSITIELLDPQFRVLELNNNFSFTLNIYEITEVLKETLINTKTNNVNSTGNIL
jgi:hypothetical protein